MENFTVNVFHLEMRFNDSFIVPIESSASEIFKTLVNMYQCKGAIIDFLSNRNYNNVSFGQYIQGGYYPIGQYQGKNYLDYCSKFNKGIINLSIY